MDKADEELFKKHAKKRIALIHPGKNDRKQIKNVLREDGLTDIVEFDDFGEAWDRLKLTTVHILVFPHDADGQEFLGRLIDSARFQKSPMIAFGPKADQHAKRFAAEDEQILFYDQPMNGVNVEKGILEVFRATTVGRSMVADENAALDHFTKATQALGEDKCVEAKELLRLALKENPEFFDAYIRMADALMCLGEFEAATKVLVRADQLRPNNAKVLVRLVSLAAETQGKEKALKVALAAAERVPNDQMLLIEMGNVLMKKGWVDEAIILFEKARDIDPNLIHVYNRLGIAYSRKKNFDGAEAMYHKALEIDADDPGVHFNMGMMYYRKGDKEKAVTYLKKTVNLDPDMVEPRELLEKIASGS
jgi:Flp pilus assembly protein TadD